MITIKSPDELSRMRQAGIITGNVLQQLTGIVKAGITTKDIDKEAKSLIEKAGGKPAFYNYKGYPGNICVSINNEVVHGIPSKRKIREGDIVSLDVGVEYDSYFADSALTFGVGKISELSDKLIRVTKESLYFGIEKAREGNRLSDISHAVQEHAENNGFSVVRAFVGHGIGTKIHEDPAIPNYGPPNQGIRLKKGMVLAIEPMVNAGTFEVEILRDGWTAVTRDGASSAHFEHTVAVTDNDPEIFTIWQKKKQ